MFVNQFFLDNLELPSEYPTGTSRFCTPAKNGVRSVSIVAGRASASPTERQSEYGDVGQPND